MLTKLLNKLSDWLISRNPEYFKERVQHLYPEIHFFNYNLVDRMGRQIDSLKAEKRKLDGELWRTRDLLEKEGYLGPKIQDEELAAEQSIQNSLPVRATVRATQHDCPHDLMVQEVEKIEGVKVGLNIPVENTRTKI